MVAVGYTSGDDRKLNVAGGTMTGPLILSTGQTASGGGVLTPTGVKTANYTAAAGDLVLVNAAGGSFTVTLPTTPADKTQIAVKMVTAPGVNTVSVTVGGSAHFNTSSGGTTGALALLGHSMFMQYQSSGDLWFTVADDLPLTQTDARYTARAVALSLVLGG